jgi:lincosamide nucleotidyltransferase A/C/D/E
VTADDVIEVLDRIDAAGVWYCIEGGWGVDALLGEQSRRHRDLDVGIRAEDLGSVCAALSEFERDEVEWPASLFLRDRRGRVVDCSVLTFDASGDGWQPNAKGPPHRWPSESLDARGQIGGRPVRCIAPELQLRWHSREGVDDVDWADMRALADRFGLQLPAVLARRPGFVASRRTLSAE